MADNPPRPPEASGTGGSPRRGLGRGLGALIPGADMAAEPAVVELPVDRIRPNSLQPRAGFAREPLAELEASIREHGVLPSAPCPACCHRLCVSVSGHNGLCAAPLMDRSGTG